MNKELAHRRLIEALEYLKNHGRARNHEEIANLSGVSRPNVTSAINGNPRYVTDGFLKRFAKAYDTYLNENWLLTGEGIMIKPDQNNLRPHIPSEKATVAAGFIGTSIGSVEESECDMLSVMPFSNKYDFTIQVNGDSMSPTLINGDILACAWLQRNDRLSDRHIYVLDTNEGASVKRVRLSNDGLLLCHSDNPRYSDFKIELASIIRIAQVIGLMRNL